MQNINFTDDMIKAILEGRKTQTRRVVKDKDPETWYKSVFTHIDDWIECVAKYKTGETVYVPEEFMTNHLGGTPIPKRIIVENSPHSSHRIDFYPAERMKSKDSSLLLKITNVRVERVLDISIEDCAKEGISTHLMDMYPNYIDASKGFKDKAYDYNGVNHNGIQMSFFTLMDSIYKKLNTNNNYWVWVYEFERVT